jgi:hypothetical protein
MGNHLRCCGRVPSCRTCSGWHAGLHRGPAGPGRDSQQPRPSAGAARSGRSAPATPPGASWGCGAASGIAPGGEAQGPPELRRHLRGRLDVALVLHADHDGLPLPTTSPTRHSAMTTGKSSQTRALLTSGLVVVEVPGNEPSRPIQLHRLAASRGRLSPPTLAPARAAPGCPIELRLDPCPRGRGRAERGRGRAEQVMGLVPRPALARRPGPHPRATRRGRQRSSARVSTRVDARRARPSAVTAPPYPHLPGCGHISSTTARRGGSAGLCRCARRPRPEVDAGAGVPATAVARGVRAKQGR